MSRLSPLFAAKLPSSIFRAGIIPYTTVNQKIYYCLGMDWPSGDYTDFGGRFSPKMDNNLTDCAMRELREESLDVFPTSKNIDDCLAIYDNSTIIIFMKVSGDMNKFTRTFERVASREMKRRPDIRLEVKSIKWFAQHQMKGLANSKSMYALVSKLIRSSLDDIHVTLRGRDNFDNAMCVPNHHSNVTHNLPSTRDINNVYTNNIYDILLGNGNCTLDKSQHISMIS